MIKTDEHPETERSGSEMSDVGRPSATEPGARSHGQLALAPDSSNHPAEKRGRDVVNRCAGLMARSRAFRA